MMVACLLLINKTHAIQYADVNTLVITPYPADAAWDLGLRPLNNPEQRTEAYQSLENYDMNVGGLYLRMGAGFRTTFNDNIALSENNRQADLILSPRVNIGGLYQLTEVNALSFNVGIAYNFFAFENGASTDFPIITPDSSTDFTIYAGEHMRIVLYDQFSMLQDPIENPLVNNTFDFGRFLNTAGVSAYWDINEDTQMTFGYRHTLVRSINNNFGFIDRMTHSIHGQLSHQWNDYIDTGVYASTGFTDFDQSFNNNNVITTVGAYIATPLSEHLTVRADAAYVFGDFESGGAFGDQQDLDSYDFQIALDHQLNEVISHTLTGGHTARLGLQTNFYEMWFVRHHATWNLINKVSLNTQAFMESGSESAAVVAEDFLRWGAGVTLSYQVSEDFRAQLNYLYIDKDSSLSLRDYYQNRVSVDINYRF
ncbi:MAG: hypothetical protein AAFY98_11995 [Verrucomicrobiota bacterium]